MIKKIFVAVIAMLLIMTSTLTVIQAKTHTKTHATKGHVYNTGQRFYYVQVGNRDAGFNHFSLYFLGAERKNSNIWNVHIGYAAGYSSDDTFDLYRQMKPGSVFIIMGKKFKFKSISYEKALIQLLNYIE